MAERTIRILDHDPSWPVRYAAERDALWRVFADAGVDREVVAIEHIGSTSVPGLAAKPVIDVAIGVRRWPASATLLAALEGRGYVHRGEAGIAGRHYLQDAPPGAERHRQVHVSEYGGYFWTEHLRFRDRLRADRRAREDYAAVKRRMAAAHPHDALAYTDGKTEVIRRILREARASSGDRIVHPDAAEGFAAGVDDYARSRPGYPEPAVRWLADHLAISDGARVADVGAGTGSLTAPLIAAGARVIAVEPVAAMRAYLMGTVPGAEVVDGTGEEMPVPMRSVDAVVAGTAFHWFEPFAALTEAYRILRTDGGIGLVWNVRDATVPWIARWSELVADVSSASTPRQATSGWRDAVARTELFAMGPEATFDNTHVVPRETVIERMASTSSVAALDDHARAQVLERFRDILEDDPVTRGADEIGIPYRTQAHILRRVA